MGVSGLPGQAVHDRRSRIRYDPQRRRVEVALARLPESVANVAVAIGTRSIRLAGAGLSMRIVLPDADQE